MAAGHVITPSEIQTALKAVEKAAEKAAEQAALQNTFAKSIQGEPSPTCHSSVLYQPSVLLQ